MKNWVRFGIKLFIGVVLIWYVLHSKMVDFKALGSVVFSPANLLIAASYMASVVLITSFRWLLLIRAQGLSLSYKIVAQLTMIGMFFNTFMPGSVGGDLIKAWYVAGREPTRKTKSVFTVLLDRVLGLAVFFYFAAAAFIYYFRFLDTQPQIRMLAYSVWAVTAGGLIVLVVFYVPPLAKNALVQALIRWLRKNAFMGRIIEAGLLYRHHLKNVVGAFLLSCIIVASSIFYCKFLGDLLGIRMSIAQYFFICPIGFTIAAIPLLPGGIGVGQVAFFTLFQWLGHPYPDQGGTLCTLWQVYTILFNCLGAFFYLNFKRKPAAISTSAPLVRPSLNQIRT